MKALLVVILSLSISACATTNGTAHNESPQEQQAEGSNRSWVWWALGGVAIGAALLAGGSENESPTPQNNDGPNSGNTGQVCISDVCTSP